MHLWMLGEGERVTPASATENAICIPPCYLRLLHTPHHSVSSSVTQSTPFRHCISGLSQSLRVQVPGIHTASKEEIGIRNCIQTRGPGAHRG